MSRLGDALHDGGRFSMRSVATGPDDIAFQQYTGGTTGVSRGAVLLHRNVVANALHVVSLVRADG